MALKVADKKLEAANKNLKVADYKVDSHNDWCPGCGDFGILSAIQMTLADMQLEPHRVSVFAGIGCSGKAFKYINVYGIHTLHGRLLPFATGAKLANPDLTVIGVGGDGDGLGIGAGHFVNAGRRNLDFTYILFNNAVYGLTKGQPAPTLKLGKQPKSLPQPNINEAINPLFLALASGYTFIARTYSFDVKHQREIIRKGIEHKGSAYIDILQPCPTYNNINTKEWFNERVYKLDENEFDPVIKAGMSEDEMDEKFSQFIDKATEWSSRIPLGVLYQNQNVPTYEERVENRIKNFRDLPPAKRPICDVAGKPTTNLEKLFESLRVT